MKFDNLQLNTPLTSSSVNSAAQQPIDEKLDNEREETAPSTASTLTFSDTGQTLASQKVTKTYATKEINNEDEALQSLKQFQLNAANDALLTEQAQSANITSTVVRNLLG